jgi:ABC-type multidrug transport system fused ATPase/permease subunit
MAYLKLFREMWRYAGGDRWKIVVLLVFHALSYVGTLLQPLIFAQILNELQTHPADLIRRLLFWFGAWVASFLWFNLFHRIARYFEFNIGYRTKQRFIKERYASATQLSLKWHSDHHSGEIINRINIAADALQNFACGQQDYVRYVMWFWGPLIGLATISWEVSLVAFVLAILIILIIKVFDQRLAHLYDIMNQMQHRIAAVLYDYLGNIKTIITLRLGQQTSIELDHRLEAGYIPYIRAEALVNATKWFIVTSAVLCLEAGVILFYILRRLHAGQTVLAGSVTALFQYLQQMSQTFYDIAEKYQQVVNWWVAYQAVEIIPPTVINGGEIQNTAADWINTTISDLTFRHGETLTLDGITLSLTAGEKIAFVGESGSGKSSLMGVLRGLYEPQTVHLEIDGRTFDTLAPLAGITTLIPQEPEIFENTIRYNITFGVEHSEAEVLEAVKIARFDAVLERLPNGLETDVRERGVTLSGGERQRLALARGILAASDSSIILMDEPTSSVDAYNEALIYENLFARYPDRTIVASIHRLHMLGRFDRVVVMERGRIVQVGAFEALKAEDGVFRTLWEKAVE